MYDIFFVGQDNIDNNAWNKFKQKFPNAQKVENAKTFNDVSSKSFTKHFWVVWDNITLKEDFQLDYRIPKWDSE